MEKEIYSLYVNDSSKEVRCALVNKGLSGDDVAAFLVEHSDMLSAVTHLNLSENKIVSLPDLRTYLPMLQKITLYKNVSLREIPEWILSLPALDCINAQRCNLQSFPILPSHKTCWSELILSYNSIEKIVVPLQHIQKIDRLHLDHNPLSVECIEMLSQVQSIESIICDEMQYEMYRSLYKKLQSIYRKRKIDCKITIRKIDSLYSTTILSD